MEEKICKNCRHFHQHYVRCHRRYMETAFGHCAYPRMKSRSTETPACQHYAPRGASPAEKTP